MSGNVCLLCPRVRKISDKSKMDSPLWKDLMSAFKNKSIVKIYYAIAHNDDFIRKAEDNGERVFFYNDTNEMTFESFVRIAKIGETEDIQKRLDHFNSTDTETDLNFNEALNSCREFNQNNINRHFFLKIYKKNENEKYNTLFVPRTKNGEEDFVKSVKYENLLNKCLIMLSQMGYKIEEADGKFMIKDPEDLFTVFDVVLNGKSIEDASDEILLKFCEYITNFEKAGSRKDLINRSLGLIEKTPSLYEEYKKTDASGEEVSKTKEEIFAELLFKALKNNKKYDGIIERAISAIKNFILNILPFKSKIKDIYNSAILITDEYFRNFIDTQRIRDSIKKDVVKSPILVAFEGAKTEIANLIKIFNNTGDSMAKRETIQTLLKGSLEKINEYNHGLFNNIIVYDDFSKILQTFNSRITVLLNDLSKYDQNDTSIYENSKTQLEIAKKVYEIRTVLDSFNNIVGQATSLLNSTVPLEKESNPMIKELKKSLKKYKEDISKIDTTVYGWEVALCANFFKSIYGTEELATQTGIMFGRKKEAKLGVGFIQYKGRAFGIDDMIRNFNADGYEPNEVISVYRNWMATMYNNTDIQGKMIDYANKQVEDKINKEMEAEIATISKIVIQMDSIEGFGRGKHHLLYEKLDNGDMSGNYISEYNRGQFEKDKQDRIKEIKEKWEEKFAKELEAQGKRKNEISKHERNVNWEEYREKELRKFFNEKVNGVTRGKRVKRTREDGTEFFVWIPGDYYKNEKYEELVKKYPGIDKALEAITKYKYRQDLKLLGFGAPMYRAPQISGYSTQMLSNAIANKSMKYFSSWLRRLFHSMFYMTTGNTEWGSDINNVDSLKEEEEFKPSILSKDINTLTIYGVKKLYDPNILSTDIMHSLIAYTNMATSYKYKNVLMSTLNSYDRLLKNRKTTEVSKFSNFIPSYIRRADTRNYDRIKTYIRANILGKKYDMKPSVIARGVKKLQNAGVFLALGGNNITALINAGTGLTDCLREGIARGNYNVADFAYANFVYGKSALGKAFKKIGGRHFNKNTAVGNEITDSYIDAFSRRFNIQNKNKLLYQGIKGDRNYAAHLLGSLGDAFFAAYEAGDEIMRVMPSIAVFRNTEVFSLKYDDTVNLQSLYQQAKDNVIYDASLNIDDFRTLEDIRKKILYSEKQNVKIIITDEEYDVLERNCGIKKGTNLTEYHLDAIEEQMKMLNTFFISKENKDKYLKLEEIIKELKYNLNNPDYTLDESKVKYLYENFKINNTSKEQIINDCRSRQGELIWGLKDESRILAKDKDMLTDFHGIYDDIDAIRLQCTYAGSLILGMKGYVPGYVSRSFAGYNKWTGKEGFVTTAAKAIAFYAINANDKGYCRNLALVGKMLAAPFFRSSIINSMMDDGFSEYQAQNILRCWTEIVINIIENITLSKIKGKLAYLEDKLKNEKFDTEEALVNTQNELKMYYRIAYILERLSFERLSYLSPKYFKKEFDNVTEMLPSGINVLWNTGSVAVDFVICKFFDDEIDGIFKDSFGNDIMKRSDLTSKEKRKRIRENYDSLIEEHPSLEGKIYSKNDKAYNAVFGQPKYKNKLAKKTPFYRDYYFWENPENIYKSFEFFNLIKK
jgi:hypothetical protein